MNGAIVQAGNEYAQKRTIKAVNVKRNTVNITVLRRDLQNVFQSIFLLLHRKKPPSSVQQHRKDPMRVCKRFARVNIILTKSHNIYFSIIVNDCAIIYLLFVKPCQPIINPPPLTSFPLSSPTTNPGNLSIARNTFPFLPVQRRNPLPMQCPYVLIQRL